MKPLILFVLADLEVGGAQRVILTVIRHLDRQRFVPHLVIAGKQGPLRREIPDNIPVHDLKVSRVRYALPALLRLCWSLKPDRVVSTLGHLNLLLLASKGFFPKGTSLTVREANTASIRLQYTEFPGIYRWLYRMLYPLADTVVCNSQYMSHDLVEHFSLKPDLIRIIPNPVDVERIKRRLGENSSPIVKRRCDIVAVGRLSYQKGFDLLLRAFHRALKDTAGLHLTIVGDGPEEKKLRRLADELFIADSVDFAGHKDNPFPYMAAADFVVLSSRWEGSPNTVLESLVCGTPVLAFDCPGGTREILRDGENGWLVAPADWETMGRTIVDLVEGKRWIHLKNNSLLPKAYRCEDVVRQWEKLFTDAINSDVLS